MNTTKERYEGERTRKTDMIWSATQVGLRTVEAGLGGHDACASVVDEGVSMSSFPISKRGRLVMSDCPTFIGFVWSGTENISENQKQHRHLLLTMTCS